MNRSRTTAAVGAAVLVASRIAAAAPPDTSPERIRDALREAYRDVRSEPSFFERAGRVLRWLLGEFQSLLFNVSGPESLIAWLVIGAVVVGAFLFLRRLALVPQRRPTRADSGDARDRVDWERMADQALAAGDIGGAVRARFGRLIEVLAARGVLRDHPSLTAGECRGAVRSSMPGAYATVARATEVFELAAYAHARLTHADVQAVRDAERAVEAA